MSEYADNYMTDEKNVHWVKMDYVGPIMKKTELAMDKLQAIKNFNLINAYHDKEIRDHIPDTSNKVNNDK